MKPKNCPFCEATKKVDDSLYIFESVDGKRVPVQVPVCKECKKEYEASFPAH